MCYFIRTYIYILYKNLISKRNFVELQVYNKMVKLCLVVQEINVNHMINTSLISFTEILFRILISLTDYISFKSFKESLHY